MNREIILTIAGAAVATYFTRFPLMILSGNKKIPEWLQKYMGYIAPAVLTALIVPSIFVKEGRLDISFTNTALIAAAITVLITYYTKNMLVSVISGVVIVGLLTFLI